jgi:HEAT repeats
MALRMGILDKSRSLRRALACVVVGAALASTAATVSRAEDPSATMRELAEASDFRVRVSAALVLGHTRPDGAREALETALGDGHPAVRVAVARALGSLGDPAALPALQRRLGQDSSSSVTAQLRVAIAELRRSAGSDSSGDDARHLGPGVHYLVELGSMRNHSSVGGERGDELAHVLSAAARARAQGMKGAEFIDGDESLRQQANARHVPVITLDGNVTQVTEARVGGGLQVQVRVEFAVRRGQTLRGTVSGAATTFGPGSEVTDEGRRRLEDDAVQAAVQSALRGAEDGLLVAAR